MDNRIRKFFPRSNVTYGDCLHSMNIDSLPEKGGRGGKRRGEIDGRRC